MKNATKRTRCFMWGCLLAVALMSALSVTGHAAPSLGPVSGVENFDMNGPVHVQDFRHTGPDMKKLHLLKPGTYTDMNGNEVPLTAGDIQRIAAVYDAKLHESPMVVGHPKTDDPAYGWIKSLSADKRGSLWGEPFQVSPEFAEKVRQGQFKKLSVSLYGPDHQNNPTPGDWHLRHVGFLGAMPPVVKGLEPVAFSEGDSPDIQIEVSLGEGDVRPWVFGSIARALRGIREWIIEDRGMEAADSILPDYGINDIAAEEARLRESGKDDNHFSEPDSQEEDDMNEKEKQLAQKEAELAERETKLAEQEKQGVADRAAAQLKADAEFAEKLVDEGRLLPRHREGIVGILAGIEDGQTVQFSEEDGKAPVEKDAKAFMQDFLSGLPVQVDYGERAPATGDGGGTVVKFKLPAGAEMSSARLDLHNRAVALSESGDITYNEAVDRLSAGS